MENIKTNQVNIKVPYKRQSQFKEIFRRFCKSKGAVIGLVIFTIICVVLISANLIVPYEKAITQDFDNVLVKPSKEFIFGTDNYGRDIFARIIYGGRTSISIAIIATFTSAVFGSILGAIAGYYGGRLDGIIMRSLDIFMSIPDILFTMAIVFALGANFVNLIIALTIAYFTNYVRLVRSQVLSLSEQDYVEAAKVGGATSFRIIATHLLPNAMGVIIVNLTLNVAKVIIYQSTLSFLGLGMPPPKPEWGLMLAEAREFMRAYPHLLIFPASAIVLCASSANLIGDGLRDAMDPHLKS